MRALRVTGSGGIENLTLADIDPPDDEPGEGEVLVAVAGAGVNFADLLMAEGRYQERPDLPFTAGMELSGTVLAVGPKVDGVFVGDRIAAASGSGAFAERAIVKDHACLLVPNDFDLVEAAALPIAYGTAHVGLTHRARLKAGELLLVTGAGGGVGLAAVAVGAALGAEVIAAASSAEKLDLAEAAGATHRIDYATEDLRERVKQIAAEKGKRGADVVFDPVGGEIFEAAMRATGFEGRLLVVGFAGGTVQQVPANHLLVKNIDVLGFYWGGYGKLDPAVHRESFRALHGMIDAGAIRPHIGARLPLEEARDAYRLLAERRAVGKVVLEIARP
jgi:NADPH2:quinone reductase